MQICGVTRKVFSNIFSGANPKTKIVFEPVQDVIKLARVKFTPLEEATLDSIRFLKEETGKIINKDGNLLDNIKFNGNRWEHRLNPETFLTRPTLMDDFVDSSYLHNHPVEMPLSSNDIYTMVLWKTKKMAASVPNGGHSVMFRPMSLDEVNKGTLVGAAAKFVGAEVKQIKKLGLLKATDLERMNLLRNWRIQELSKFAKENDFEFSDTTKELTQLQKGDLPDNLFKVNIVDRVMNLFGK